MRLLFLTCIIWIAACAPQPAPLASPTSPPPVVTPPVVPTTTFTPTLPPVAVTLTVPASLAATPGLVLHGHIRLADGSPLPNVTICRNFASYAGVVAATTDQDGYYESAFAFIPGDEMVGVWPLASGYNFDPPDYRWRHYYGPEDRTLDFVASPASGTAVPPAPCP